MVRKRLGQILRELELVKDEFEVQQALIDQKESGKALGQILVEKGVIGEADLTSALAVQSGMEAIDLSMAEVPPEVLELVDVNTAETMEIMPVAYDGTTLTVAVSDADDMGIEQELRFALPGVSAFRLVLAGKDAIAVAIQRFYNSGASADGMFGEMGEGRADVQSKRGDDISLDKIEEDVNAAPVVKLLNMILVQAVRDRASDIHLEPFEYEFKVRYRVDGVLYEMMPPPIQIARALISRVKVLASLDIAETRLPQDGRIEISIGGNPIDLRVSTLPTMHGESVVMRVLDRQAISLDLAALGFRTSELETFRGLISKPNGIMLVTGPTGSGKTTTLYAALNEANTVDVKIITTEDPVEYDLEGIVQVQINEEIGTTFAACLRSILRQDPDKILVGEIRDLETCQIAVEASLTGHIVFTTLHTNDAPSAVTRLIDLGLEPFLITATLEGILAQRLVRRVCVECRQPYDPTDKELYEVELTRTDVAEKQFFFGKGCKKCNGSGYKGRIALFEIMVATDRVKELIMNSASTAALRDAAREEGMRTLRDGGLLHIYDGVTSIEEVVRETMSSI